MSYTLEIKEGLNVKEFPIKTNDTELALYEAIDTLELYLGADWLKNANERLKISFNNMENELKSKGKTEMGFNITLKRERRK